MKLEEFKGSLKKQGVAPHVGAWIEIENLYVLVNYRYVAPHVGAWIEILRKFLKLLRSYKSHPTWVRGLKSNE